MEPQPDAKNALDRIAGAREWHKETLARKVIDALKKNNMTGMYVKTKQEALDMALSLIPGGSSVARGSSVSLDELGINDILRTGKYRFIDRRKPGLSEEEDARLRRESLLVDYYLMSTNALTLDGKLVNIDGYGNRVAALIFGPTRVIIVAGVNKIVADTQEAIHHIKNYTAPIHAARRDRPVPCAKTGRCMDCHAPRRMCSVVSIIEFQRHPDRITVIICGEELGY